MRATDRRINDHAHLGPGDGGWLPEGAVSGYGRTTIVTSTTSGGAANLGDLGDVNLVTTPPTNGQGLTYNTASGKWIPGTGVSALDDLTDVTITTPAAADRLRYNGSAWVNSPALWVPVMVEDGATGLWYVVVTGDGDATMTEVS